MPVPLLTPQVNTLKPDGAAYPGNLELEKKIEEAILWNSSALVHNAEFLQPDKYHLGGHTATPASMSTIFLVGLLHHFQAKDHVYYQGHSTPVVVRLLVFARPSQRGRIARLSPLGRFAFLSPPVFASRFVGERHGEHGFGATVRNFSGEI